MTSKARSPQIIAINDKLREVCDSVDGYALYRPGWNDESVAKAVIPDFNGSGAHVVAKIRRDNYGNFKRAVPEPRFVSTGDLAARIGAVERWLDRVEPNWRTRATFRGDLLDHGSVP